MSGADDDKLAVLRRKLAGLRWPNHEASRIVRAAGVDFHVQDIGPRDAPALLFVHGTAASTHSHARLALEFATTNRCLLIDLPGHGFTALPDGFPPTLADMSRAVGDLAAALGIAGAAAIGHSAGAAVLVHAAQRGAPFERIIAINAALEPMRGQGFLSPLAKGLFLNPLMPQLFAWRARFGGMTRIMLRATGTHLDEEMLAQYQILLEDADHVRGALAMMASWDLTPLQDGLPSLATPLFLIAAEDDAFVPARVSREAAQKARHARFLPVASGGHLLHEMQASRIAAIIRDILAAPAP
jgi:magnesium chelatase accessory protein